MKIYDYIPVDLITNYPGWNIEGTFPAHNEREGDYVIVSRIEDKTEEYQPKLKEASTEELLEELRRRLEVTNAKD